VSNSLAISAVTSSIRYVLERSLQVAHIGAVGGARVTTLRPNALGETDLAGTAGVNVFCFLATPNHAWNLSDLPTRRGDGSLSARPVAALDLHYLMTCFGDEERLEPQRLLGRTVVALKVTPVLTRDVVAAALQLYGAETETSFLTGSDLADEIELVKLSPTPLSLEEMSKLWGVLDTPYLLSLTYLATVVLVAADIAPTVALPVRQRLLTVTPASPPRLESVGTDPPDQPVRTGTTLVLSGGGLVPTAAGTTSVGIGPAELPPQPGGTAQALRVTLDDSVPAGLHVLTVRHRSVPGPGGSPPARVTASSNAVPLLVRPVVSAGAVDATTVTFPVVPPLQAGQRASVLLGRLGGGAPDDPAGVTITAPPVSAADAPETSVAVPRTDIPDGTWLVRVQVDGAESLPDLAGESYDTPSLTLP
jgi:hypothetical protein